MPQALIRPLVTRARRGGSSCPPKPVLGGLINKYMHVLTWHLRQALAKLTLTDQHIPEPSDPVAPAQRSRFSLASNSGAGGFFRSRR
jgi:hypothetical protein